MGPIRELGPAALLRVRPEDVRALTEVVSAFKSVVGCILIGAFNAECD